MPVDPDGSESIAPPGGSSAPGRPSPLREQAYRSGRILVARQLTGMALRIVGILIVTRIIGPTAYGLFAGASAIAAVLSTVAIFGMDVHLIRSMPQDPRSEHTAFTMLALSSAIVGVAAFLAAEVFGSWLGDDGVVGPMRVMAALVPVMVLWVPARARLERQLRFGPLAAIEVGADVVVYLVAVPLAVAGAGVWSPVGGFAARHVVLLVATHLVAGYRPRPAWQREEVRRIFRFGSGYSAGRWVSLGGQLVNPILVGRLLGPSGVGYVAMSSRIVEQLGAVKQATVRLATAALAKLGEDRGRLRSAHNEGVLVQMLGAVPLYAVGSFVAPWAIPWLFGPEWEPAVKLLALLALAASVGVLFNLHATTLRVLGRNAPVARLRVAQVVALVGATAVLVPPLGVIGYGWARLIRTLPFVMAHRDLSEVFPPRYGPALRWLVGFVPMMASPWLAGPWRPLLLIPIMVVLATPVARRELMMLLDSVGGRQRPWIPRRSR